MSFTIDPTLIENDEVRITEDNSGDLALEHVPSGTTMAVDEDLNISDFWDSNNSEITADVNNQSLSTERLSTTYYTSPRGSDGGAIQSALDAANAASGPAKVVIDEISSAPYLVSNAPLLVYDETVVEIREDVKLGDNQDANIFETEGSHGTGPTVRHDVHFVGAGGELDGNGANNSGSDGNYANCIHLVAQDASVRNVKMANPHNHGVNVAGHSQNVTVRGCVLDNPGLGYQAHWHEPDTTKWEDVRFIDNTIKNSSSGSGSCFHISGGVGGRCSGNTIRDCGQQGITIFNGDGGLALENYKVTDNDIINSGQHGINVKTTDKTTGEGLRDVVVANNTILNPPLNGIIVKAGNEILEEVTISDNVIRDSGEQGILVTLFSGGTGSGTANVSINGNVIANAGTAGGSTANAIQTTLPLNQQTSIKNNVVVDSNRAGILASGQDGEVVGNTVIGSSNVGIAINDPDHLCSDNRVKNSGVDGINLNADNIVCVGNRCYDDQGTKTQSYGINISSGDYQIITSNNIRGNVNSGIGGSVGTNSVTDNNIT